MHNRQSESALPPSSAVSLDFTEAPPPQPLAPARRAAQPRKALSAKAAAPAAKPRKLLVPALVAALAIAYATSDSPPAAKVDAPHSPVEPAGASVHRPYIAHTPKAPPPTVERETAVAPPAPLSAVPTTFLQPFQAYTAESGHKAIAMALERDGRFVYASVSRHPVQAEASQEALSDCARFRAEAGLRENCRLFAVGDAIVW